MKLTDHFTLEEFLHSTTAAKYGIDNTPDSASRSNLDTLAHMLETIRLAWSKPIIITSGYRCKRLNSLVGGSSTSDHMYGRAVDIVTTRRTREELLELYTLIRKLSAWGKLPNLYQCIWEKNSWIHLSFRTIPGIKPQFFTIL